MINGNKENKIDEEITEQNSNYMTRILGKESSNNQEAHETKVAYDECKRKGLNKYSTENENNK